MAKVNLSDKAVLANLSFSRWGGHTYDRSVTDEVHQTRNAASDAGRYNKRLLAKGATSDINSVVGAAREYHRDHTQPWLDDGARILPAPLYLPYASRMKDFRREFEDAVAKFIKTYPDLVKDAEKRLGKMFSAADYPSVEQLKGMYSFRSAVTPFPDSDDFRVDVPAPELASMKKEMKQQMDEVYKGALNDTATRIVETVGHMAGRLKSYKPGEKGKRAENTFRDSLVENVRQLAEVLPAFNMGNDAKLAKVIAKIQKDLCANDATALREDENLRQKVATSADQILTAISDYIA